jgi:hypothetical protein
VFGQPLLQRKTKSITHFECVFGDVGIQHAMGVRHIVVCGLPGSKIFFKIISQTARLSKKIYWTSTDFIWNISHSRKNWARYLKCISVFMCSNRYSCPILMNLEFSRKIFHKYSNIKFHENPSTGSLGRAFRASEIWPCISELVYRDISMDRCAFIFKGLLRNFGNQVKLSVNIPQDQKPQHKRCETKKNLTAQQTTTLNTFQIPYLLA